MLSVTGSELVGSVGGLVVVLLSVRKRDPGAYAEIAGYLGLTSLAAANPVAVAVALGAAAIAVGLARNEARKSDGKETFRTQQSKELGKRFLVGCSIALMALGGAAAGGAVAGVAGALVGGIGGAIGGRVIAQCIDQFFEKRRERTIKKVISLAATLSLAEASIASELSD